MDNYDQDRQQFNEGYDREWGAIFARQRARADDATGRAAFALIGATITWQRRRFSRVRRIQRRWYATWSLLSLGSLAAFFYADGTGLRGDGLTALLVAWPACWVLALLGLA